MGRQKSKENAWLPKYCKPHKGRIVYTPYLGCENGKPVFDKEIVLGKITDSKSSILKNYENVTGESGHTLKWILDKFKESEQYQSLKPKTKKGYEVFYRTLVNMKGEKGTFGELAYHYITAPLIRQYLDLRLKQNSPKSGNKEIGFLSSAWSWMRERKEGFPANPCIGVKRNPAPRRQHYAEDEDYYHALFMPGPAYIPLVMEICYNTKLRKGEVLDLREIDILENGLLCRRGKGSKDTIVKWTPRLRATVDAALALPRKVSPLKPEDRYLLCDKYGAPINESTFDTAWQRRMKNFTLNGGERFTVHDLKRKGTSDHKGDKLKAGGWVDPSMVLTYDVKPDEVDSTR